MLMQLSINCRIGLRLEPQAPAVSRQAEFSSQTCSSVAMVRTARRRMLTLLYAADDASHNQGCVYH